MLFGWWIIHTAIERIKKYRYPSLHNEVCHSIEIRISKYLELSNISEMIICTSIHMDYDNITVVL